MYPDAYIDYLVYFHGPRDYFECHEVLEEHWKKDQRGERKPHWVGLIQISVALYHQRLGNFNGAKRLMKNAIQIIEKNKKAIEELSLDYHELLKILKGRHQELVNKKPYTSINLPLTNEQLLKICKKQCKEKYGCNWGDPSDLSNKALIQKHSLRDRTEVINERNTQKKLKERRRKAN